ncbi:hypothetical protein THAOC_03813 [Thalassiosira oceanica]|uniref:Uncharacterized protein n=1 Tax=Thalassiosira oceanica TaxID=159749 RepID=K0TBK3_THAOC|nr:hypothetical protein THAOC_03813 [Thalassiosira oceanica]|eukprot:EJK74504.1 hypothetical protein THAOC_03813 [Thalassiosira oceanica]
MHLGSRGRDHPSSSRQQKTCGNVAGLVQDLVNQALQRVGAGRPTVDPEKKNRAFNSTVLNGQIRKGVRNLTDRGGGRVLPPDNKCTKTDRPVIEVLEEKHPEMQMPDLTDRTTTCFEEGLYNQEGACSRLGFLAKCQVRYWTAVSGGRLLTSCGSGQGRLGRSPSRTYLAREQAGLLHWTVISLGFESPPETVAVADVDDLVTVRLGQWQWTGRLLSTATE